VETVDNYLVTNVCNRTTSMQDVYTLVDKTVDNLLGCGMRFYVSQETAQLLIGYGEYHPVIHRVINTRNYFPLALIRWMISVTWL
jgi:hypothetical protein